MKKWSLAVAVMLLITGGCIFPAHAEILFLSGNHPQPDEQNVLFNKPSTDVGHTIEGYLNQAGTLVSFTSSSLLLGDGGQAEIKACTSTDKATCGKPATFTDLLAFLTAPPGGVFTDLIFNLDAVADGNLTITVTEGSGVVQSATANHLDQSGANFYTVVAIDGQDIRSVQLQSTVGIVDASQLRLSGVQPESTVPEPASILLLGTVLSLGAYQVRRRRAIR